MELMRYVRIGVLSAVFAVPFVVLLVAESMYFPFITGKNFAFRILVEVAFFGWVVLALSSAQYRPRRSLALLVGGAFVVAIGISTLVAENPVKAFWSNFERMEGYITILHLGAYVLVLTTVLKTEQLWKYLTWATLSAATLVGIYSVFQLLGAAEINQGGLRIDATLGNATYFAVYMLIHAFLALYAYVRWTGESRWARIGLGTLFALFSILVFYSATRGTILGLIGGLGLTGLALVVSKQAGRTVRYVGVGAIALILCLAAGFYTVKDTAYVQGHPILSRIASISLDSGATRFAIWDMALKGVAERPVFGWGQEGFNFIFNKYYDPKLVNQEPWFDRAHNVILDWLVAGGVVGMALYLGLYAVLFYYLWRPGSAFETRERAILTGLIAAYGFHNIFVFDNLMSYVMFMMLFSYITFRATSAQVTPPIEDREILPTSVSVPVALVALLVVSYFANWPGYASATGVIQGLSPHPEGVVKNLEYFTEAGSRTGLGYQETGEQFLQFALQVVGLNAGDAAFQSATVQAARKTFEGVLAQTPSDARLLVFYGAFNRQIGDFARAREYMDKALAISPQKQSILIEYGGLAMAERRYDDAVNIYESIYATSQRYARVHVLLANAYLMAGRTTDASALLIKEFGTDEPDDVSVASAYLMTGKYDKAVRIAERIVAENPSRDSYRFLAGVYLEGKEREKALATLETGKVVDPSFTAEADAYIAAIRAGSI